METVSCNVNECDNSVFMENKVSNTKRKRKRSKERIRKEKQDLDRKDGEILTRSNDARADPSGSEVGVVSVSNVEMVEEKKEDGMVQSSGSEVVDAVNEEKNKKKKVKKKNKKLKLDTDKPEEDGSAKVLQDADVNHLDNSVPLQNIMTDKEKVGVLGEGDNSVSVEMKKKKKKLRKRKKKEPESESGSSNVNELHGEKSVETNNVSVETSSIDVKVLQDVDVNLVGTSVPLQGNVSLVIDKEKVGVLGEGGDVSVEMKKKKKKKSRKNKEQEGASEGCNVNELQVEKSLESNRVSAEISSVNVVPSEDLDEGNCRKRSRLDGSSEGKLDSSKEDVQDKETKKKEKLKRKGNQRKGKEQENKSRSSNVNELHAEKCVENNQVSVEMSNVNVTNNEDLDEESCRKRRLDESLKGNPESSMEDIQGRSPCSVDEGKKVESLGCTLGQVEVREQASSKQVDAQNSWLQISTKNCKGKFLLIDSQEGVNMPISRGGIREVTLSKDNCVAETSGEKNDVEQPTQGQLVPQTQTDNNSEVKVGNPKGDSNALCCAHSNNSVLQTCAMVNTDSTVAVCPSKKVVSKDDVVSDVIDKEKRTIQHVQHCLTASIQVKPSKKKLLILDVNGLLADIVQYDNRVRRKPDAVVSGKAVFKRPFVDDFLQFCFDNFAVGVWSSRTKRNVEMVVDFLMGNSREKLLFCWDQSHCTITKFTTIQNREKPLVFKELKKLWEKLEPDLPWMKGEYNESNTLLLDDSPYKALLNPAHTAIFPYSYEYTDSKDNSLGPGGDLRVYLERLSLAKDVQEYLQWHPFGQRAITSRNPSWGYYEKVISAVSPATARVIPR